MSKGRISDHTISNIFNSTNIVDVIGPEVQLKKSGANHTGCCPFHKEKTGSFVVSPAKQIFKCFGCGEGGNAVHFLMKHKNFTYPDALDYLAGLYNITIEYEDSDYTPEKKEDIQRRSTCINAVVGSYKKQINPEVKKYLTKRGFTEDDIIQWNIGYAPKGGKFITDKVIDTGYFREAEELFIVGTKNSKNYDRLQDRITIPLQDHFGNFIGISGRQYTPNKKYPKYINPADTPLYKKDAIWYGLNFAIKSIRKNGYANIVEGYTDVIAMHRKKIDNTIASCGTSITINQVKILKRFTNKVQLVLDGDKAGKKAALKLIDLFVEQGFYVYIKFLPNKQDPDDYINTISPGHKIRLNIYYATDAVQYKITKMLSTAKTFEDKALIADAVAVLLSKVANAVYRENYIAWIGKEHKDFKKPITELLKDKVLKTARKDNDNVFHASEHDKNNYTLPKEVNDKWAKLKDDILKYGMFTHRNSIYMRRGSEDNGFYFKKVTNFSIKIIQHMEDEKRPLKLVSIQNIHNRNRTFDTPSEDFVTELGFKKMVTGKGNFNWQGDGGANDFSRLTTKLYDDMGDGRMITVLGWQEEGFFALNNVVIVDGRVEKLDKNGCFDNKGASYYIPSANHIYANNPTKFIPQKRAIYTETTRTFNEVAQQITKVHRKHAMNAMLFTVASCFSDVVYNKVSFFPILFLYGEPSSGKDNLIECCQSFFGKPQTPITITGKANTDKAKIRKFAQFRNMIGHMTEYSNGSDDTDQMMKSFWDRVGYERGTIDSAVGTESIAIEMSVIFTGNDYPTNDALITRIITEEMNKTDFSDEEKNEYEKLKEMMQDGISSLTAIILAFRKNFEQHFRKEFKAAQLELRHHLSDISLPDRMITNAAVLGATYKITNEKLDFGFTYQEWMDHVKIAYKNQANKMATGSVVSQFWDCFFDGVRASFDNIEQHTEFSIEGDNLIINFNLTYPKYQKTHFNLFKKPALSKSVLMDKLKKSDGFIEQKSSHRYGNARTSGYVFDINRIGIKEDLLNYLSAKDGTKKFKPNNYQEPMVKDELPFD
jgi:DNA primase catalytic core